MKKLFIFTGLMAVLFMAAVYNVEAQKSKPRVRILTGTIKSYECGDNCYLTIADATGW